MRSHFKVVAVISALILSALVLGVSLASATAPTTTIDPASSIAYTTAHLSGKVDPQDQETSYRFEYTTDPGSGIWNLMPGEGPLAAGSGETAVEADVTGLQPGTEYFARLVASNADGEAGAGQLVSFRTQSVPPAKVSIAPPSLVTATSAHFSGTINPEATAGNPSVFNVNWRFECTPACPGTTTGAIDADNLDHEVSTDVFGLLPGISYEVRLIAANAGGEAVASESFATQATPPQLLETWANPLPTESMLGAMINPGGLATTYHFEYGTSTGYGGVTPEKTIAAGGKPVTVSATVLGLAPGTAYHFRVVATNSADTTVGPDQTFVTETRGTVDTCPNAGIRTEQESKGLPECRAYEQVSPQEKGGVDVLGDTQRPFTKAGPTGSSIAYGAPAAFGDPKGSAFPSIYRAVRGATGWASEMVSPPQNATIIGGLGGGNTSVVSMFTSNLGAAIIRTNRSLDFGAGENVPNLYGSDLASGAYRLLSPGGPSEPSFTTVPPELGWATPDLSAVVFASQEALTPDAPVNSQYKTYVYRDGAIELASVLPGDVPAVGSPGDIKEGNTKGAISADGKRVFFVDPTGVGQGLWVRDLESGITTQIVDPSTTVRFLAASPDGSKVLWHQINPNTNSESLFIYDVDSGTIETAPNQGPNAINLTSVLAASDDLSSVYFVSTGGVVPGQPAPPTDSSIRSPLGIYRWQPEIDRVDFVAYFAGGSTNGDRLQFEGGIFDGLSTRRDIATTADGSVLAFATDAKVMPPSSPGYENSSPSPACDDDGEERCKEVYRFDADTETVTCVSCPGGAPTTNASLPGGSTVSSSSTINQRSFAQANAVSADGSTVFFETGERLASADINGRDDVYMWKQGARQLLSSGTSNYNSRLLDASPSGNDVFIATRAPLVGWDRDELADIYDVRVGGGFPEPPPAVVRCEGSECQVGSGQPPAALVGSAALSGRGNLTCRRASPQARKLSRRAGKLRGKAKRLRVRSRRLVARSARADAGDAARLQRQSKRLAASAAKASRRSKALGARARRLQGANCRGAK